MKVRTSEDFGLLILLGCIVVIVISNIIEIAMIKTEITDMRHNLYDVTYRLDSADMANDTIEYFSNRTQHYETVVEEGR